MFSTPRDRIETNERFITFLTDGLQYKSRNTWPRIAFHKLLTHSMVQSPSWAENWFAASQEISSISRNPKVHYRTHKRPPPVSILGQPNSVYIPTSHLLQIHPNIIHPSMPRSPQWSLSLRFPHQGPIHPPHFINMKYILFSSLNIHHFHQITTLFLNLKKTGWVNKFLVLCNLNFHYNIKTKMVNVHFSVKYRRLRTTTVVVEKQ